MNTAPSTLATLIRKLTALLTEQETEIRGLTRAMKGQRQMFVSHRTEDVESARTTLEEAAKRCLELEAKRMDVVKEVGAFLGVPFPHITAKKLAAASTDPSARSLVSQAERTKKAAEALRVESMVGESLLAWSARWHDGLMRSIAEALTPCANTYTKAGDGAESRESARMLDALI